MCLIKFLCLLLSRFKVRARTHTHTYYIHIYIFSVATMHRRRRHCYYIQIYIYIFIYYIGARGDFEADLFFVHRRPVNGDLLSTVDWLLVRFVQTFCSPPTPTRLGKYFLFHYSNSTLTSQRAIRILREKTNEYPPSTYIKRKKSNKRST